MDYARMSSTGQNLNGQLIKKICDCYIWKTIVSSIKENFARLIL